MAKVWKFGSDVDTDQIVPGRYAPYMRPKEDVGTAAFIEARPDFNQQAAPGDIIVAGENFGCGSSREYAVLALKRRKIGAIIAGSFARIFYRNAINLGIPLYESREVVQALADGQEVVFHIENQTIQATNEVLSLPRLPDFAWEIIREGGITDYVKKYGRFPGESDA